MKICERLINQHARNHKFIKQRSYTRPLYIIAAYTIDRIGSTKKVRAKSNLLIQFNPGKASLSTASQGSGARAESQNESTNCLR